MRETKITGSMVVCGIVAVVILAAMVSGMAVQDDLKLLTQSSDEITAVAGLLDSASGLRNLLLSFSYQCSLSQDSWIGALSTALGLMFMVSILGLALLLALVLQLRKNRRLTQRLMNR
ncbi:MAG: hypothetical protein ACJAWL_002445 [Motiliproteus sp.]|jgi:hypothetical protein